MYYEGGNLIYILKYNDELYSHLIIELSTKMIWVPYYFHCQWLSWNNLITWCCYSKNCIDQSMLLSLISHQSCIDASIASINHCFECILWLHVARNNVVPEHLICGKIHHLYWFQGIHWTCMRNVKRKVSLTCLVL